MSAVLELTPPEFRDVASRRGKGSGVGLSVPSFLRP